MTVTNDKTEFMEKTVERDEIPVILFDFFDTLRKIKQLENVIKVCFTDKMADIYILLENDDIDLSEYIMERFAQWETAYKVFPELHIINKNEEFYIPTGSFVF